MNWKPISESPKRSGVYFVYAPSSDPKKPFFHLACYSTVGGWSGLVPVWLKALTHWMEPEPPNPHDLSSFEVMDDESRVIDYPDSTKGSDTAAQARAQLNSAGPEQCIKLFREGMRMIFSAIRPNHWRNRYEAEKRERLRISDSKWWYKTRVDLLLEKQHMLREPERTLVIDILANGQLLPDPDGSRYGRTK